MPNLAESNIAPASGPAYPTSPDWNTGAVFGPLPHAAGGFPLGSYLTYRQHCDWHATSQLSNFQAAAAQWVSMNSASPGANPFTVVIGQIRAEIAGK